MRCVALIAFPYSTRSVRQCLTAVHAWPRPRCGPQGEDFYEARFSSAPARHDPDGRREHARHAGICSGNACRSCSGAALRSGRGAADTRPNSRNRRAGRRDRPRHRRHRHPHSAANLESAAPVTVVSDQDFKLSGTTRVEDLLNSLPSVGASQASGVSNGATGTAEVDLRYLGSKRTLALINGRRMVPGDPEQHHPGRRPQLHPVVADQARRSAHRRRLVGVRCGRGRGRRQLHHGHQLQRHPVRRPVQLLPAQQRQSVRFSRTALERQRHQRLAARLHRSDAAAWSTAARSTAPSRSASASTTTAAMRWPISAIATSIRSCRAGATSAPALSRTRRQRFPGHDPPALRRFGDGQPGHGGDLRRRRRARRRTSPRPSRRLGPGTIASGLRTSTTSRRSTISSGRTSATSPASSPIMKSRRRSSRTLNSCSWTTTRWRRSRRRATSATR